MRVSVKPAGAIPTKCPAADTQHEADHLDHGSGVSAPAPGYMGNRPTTAFRNEPNGEIPPIFTVCWVRLSAVKLRRLAGVMVPAGAHPCRKFEASAFRRAGTGNCGTYSYSRGWRPITVARRFGL